ncbi:hypothetical protein Pan5_65 [Pseudanabaena phage Pan5]|nr:hypothetical protein Pan5_65 [Pseudanabaena phage Pan5]
MINIPDNKNSYMKTIKIPADHPFAKMIKDSIKRKEAKEAEMQENLKWVSVGIKLALTSLLEELPEVDKMSDTAIIFQTPYREKIKSLIQTKLK